MYTVSPRRSVQLSSDAFPPGSLCIAHNVSCMSGILFLNTASLIDVYKIH